MNIREDKETVWECLDLAPNFMSDLDEKFNEAVFKAMELEYKTQIIKHVLDNFSYNELVLIASKYIDETCINYLNSIK